MYDTDDRTTQGVVSDDDYDDDDQCMVDKSTNTVEIFNDNNNSDVGFRKHNPIVLDPPIDLVVPQSIIEPTHIEIDEPDEIEEIEEEGIIPINEKDEIDEMEEGELKEDNKVTLDSILDTFDIKESTQRIDNLAKNSFEGKGYRSEMQVLKDRYLLIDHLEPTKDPKKINKLKIEFSTFFNEIAPIEMFRNDIISEGGVFKVPFDKERYKDKSTEKVLGFKYAFNSKTLNPNQWIIQNSFACARQPNVGISYIGMYEIRDYYIALYGNGSDDVRWIDGTTNFPVGIDEFAVMNLIRLDYLNFVCSLLDPFYKILHIRKLREDTRKWLLEYERRQRQLEEMKNNQYKNLISRLETQKRFDDLMNNDTTSINSEVNSEYDGLLPLSVKDIVKGVRRTKTYGQLGIRKKPKDKDTNMKDYTKLDKRNPSKT